MPFNHFKPYRHPFSDTSTNNGKVVIDKKQLAFAIAGSIDEIDQVKLKAILALLKKISGDASIEIIRVEEGSIRLILEGSEEGLERIKEVFESGELTEVLGDAVEYVQFVDNDSSDNQDTESDNQSSLTEESFTQCFKLVKSKKPELYQRTKVTITHSMLGYYSLIQKTYLIDDGSTVIVWNQLVV
ncbi:MAG: hypothetical protein HC907_38035 [Richelia sp. SM1_7_0]|nr:hypothetical protein [Richelia sp. SM1_7_0]